MKIVLHLFFSPFWIHFISLPFLISLARTSCKMLNRSGGRRYPSLVLDQSGKTLSILSLGVMGLSGMSLIKLKKKHSEKSNPYFLSVFITKYVEFCKILTCILSCASLFVTQWTVARQAPLSMGLSQQECQSGLTFPPPGDLPNTGIEHQSLASAALEGRFFTTDAT